MRSRWSAAAGDSTSTPVNGIPGHELGLRRDAVVPAAREGVVAARAFRREMRHPHGAVRGGGIGNLRHDDAIGAEVEHALDEERIRPRRTHEGRRAALLARGDRGLERGEVVAAVLAVEDDEIEPGGRERADHLRRRDDRPDAGDRAPGGEFDAQRMRGRSGGRHEGPRGRRDGNAWMRVDGNIRLPDDSSAFTSIQPARHRRSSAATRSRDASPTRFVLPSSLQISIVTHRPDVKLLERCLRKLALAIGAAREDGALRTVHLALIDNSEDREVAEGVIKLGKTRFSDSGVHVTYLHGHANIGYGAAHNLVLHGTGSDYHLVLNPDVELAPDALANAVRWLDEHPEVGALAPCAKRPDGTREYLCKRYPAVFDLFLRGFAPASSARCSGSGSSATRCAT